MSDLADYQALRRWAKGVHPSGQGRVWRRRRTMALLARVTPGERWAQRLLDLCVVCFCIIGVLVGIWLFYFAQRAPSPPQQTSPSFSLYIPAGHTLQLVRQAEIRRNLHTIERPDLCGG